jgi:hypothetical protein
MATVSPTGIYYRAAGGLTAFRPYVLQTSGYIGISAEL